MRIPAVLSAGLIAVGLTIGACGQTVSHIEDTRRGVGDATAQPAPAPGKTKGNDQWPDLEKQPMPTESIDKPVLLDDELRAIHDAIPAFIWVTNRDGYAAADYPTLPRMTLKNVTVGQFLQYVQTAFPGVQCLRIDGPNGPLYSIRISGNPNGAHNNHVRLYRLSEIINAQADEEAAKDKDVSKSRDDRVKAATNDVLSLLQAALDQTDPDGAMSLKIHEPTLTLMFKGSLAKQEVLEEALQTLTPRRGSSIRFGGGYSGGKSSDPFDAATKSYDDAMRMLSDQSSATQDQVKQLEVQRAQLQDQIAKMREELAAQAQHAQKPAAPDNK
jgi:hypothetical protein